MSSRLPLVHVSLSFLCPKGTRQVGNACRGMSLLTLDTSLMEHEHSEKVNSPSVSNYIGSTLSSLRPTSTLHLNERKNGLKLESSFFDTAISLDQQQSSSNGSSKRAAALIHALSLPPASCSIDLIWSIYEANVYDARQSNAMIAAPLHRWVLSRLALESTSASSLAVRRERLLSCLHELLYTYEKGDMMGSRSKGLMRDWDRCLVALARDGDVDGINAAEIEFLPRLRILLSQPGEYDLEKSLMRSVWRGRAKAAAARGDPGALNAVMRCWSEYYDDVSVRSAPMDKEEEGASQRFCQTETASNLNALAWAKVRDAHGALRVFERDQGHLNGPVMRAILASLLRSNDAEAATQMGQRLLSRHIRCDATNKLIVRLVQRLAHPSQDFDRLEKAVLRLYPAHDACVPPEIYSAVIKRALKQRGRWRDAIRWWEKVKGDPIARQVFHQREAAVILTQDTMQYGKVAYGLGSKMAYHFKSSDRFHQEYSAVRQDLATLRQTMGASKRFAF